MELRNEKRIKKSKLKSECWELIWICYLILNARITICARTHLSIYIVYRLTRYSLHFFFVPSSVPSRSIRLDCIVYAIYRFQCMHEILCPKSNVFFRTKTKIWRKNDLALGFSYSVFRLTLNSLETFLLTSCGSRMIIWM